MSEIIERARATRAQIEALAQYAPDAAALEGKALYPSFEKLVKNGYTAAEAGYKFTYGDDLYKTLQAGYTFVVHYVPGEGTESLFVRIDEIHAGTKEDPIPYNGNMSLEEGKYYIQECVVYFCFRDTEMAVYHALRDLVGLYVEEAA
ncbi:MAG: hypothetical protein J6W14_01515 [Clostridia bacterium]|nr:hypothetical protein [Clostridia bacterium]